MAAESTRVLRVLVVDDDDLFARIVAHLVAAEDDLELIGRAHDGREGIELALEYKPDLIVMDVQMPIMDGLEATRRLHQLDEVEAEILLVSGEEVAAHLDTIGAVGAVGYLPKQAVATDLVPTLRAIGAAGPGRIA
jgi:DNA-binding NarL/FixJ family response regulator